MNEYEKDQLEREEALTPPQPEDTAPAEGTAAAETAQPQSGQGNSQPLPPPPSPPRQPPYQNGGYYPPPRPQGPWQGGWQPPAGYPGWQPGPYTTGWQQPQWQGPNTTGWGPQQPGGYQPQSSRRRAEDLDDADDPIVGGPEGKKKKHRPLGVVLKLIGAAAALAVVTMAGYGIYAAATGENPLAEKLPGQSGPVLPRPGESTGGNQVPDIAINGKPGNGEDWFDGSEGDTLSNTAIFKKVSPSVVGIVARLGDSIYGSASQGSGIIMTEDGYIITNAHVVDGASSYEVVLTGGESYSAQLVGADLKTDLAVLKVDQTGLACAEFGDSDQVEVGERACVIGNPGGLRFQNSLTVGYISALKRTINTGGYSIDCIQTDAAINPGNSGGPLINAYGQVIGISSAKIALTDYEGICFAIPITDAMPILRQLIADGKVSGRAMLGVSAKAVKATEAEFYEIPMGLWVVGLTPGADIGTKGVREGDIITHVADTPVFSLDACSSVLKDYAPGDVVTITVFRRESSMTDNTFKVDITLQGS